MKPDVYRQNTYDQFADQYAKGYESAADGQFNFNRDFIIPQLLKVVGSVEGLTVLDAGCGEGIVSRQLAAEKASVYGIDVSPRLIELARQRDQLQAVTYAVHDLSRPLPEFEGTFDLVVSNMVLNDVPNYKGFIATLSSVLKPNSRVVMSINNPYSALIREKVDDYFDSGKAVLYGMAQEGVAVYYYHHTLAEYMSAFQTAGLLLRSLVDMRLPKTLAARLPEKSKEFPWYPMYTRFPFMQVLELVKET